MSEAALSQWQALRELRFSVGGKQVIVAQGARVPVACWAACNPRTLAAVRDPAQRRVVLVETVE